MHQRFSQTPLLALHKVLEEKPGLPSFLGNPGAIPWTWFVKKFGLALLLVFTIGPGVEASDTGQFQLTLATPDPVVAGEKVKIQVIAVNQGTKEWKGKKFFLQAEIYDRDGTYRAKSERIRGTKDVKPGETIFMAVPVEIPVNFGGRYRFRVFLVNRGQRVIESDLLSFSVRERPISIPKPPPVALGGNMVLAFKNESGPEDYVGNFSLNAIGRIEQRSFMFNTYTFHGPDDSVDVYTVLFNYYGPKLTAGLGDVSPSFSPPSVYGQGMRGAMLETKGHLGDNGWEVSFVGARTATSEEGSSSTDGVFRRMLYGGRGKIQLPANIVVGVDYATSLDVESSLETPGPTLTPVDNRIAGGELIWGIFPGMKIGGEFQSSSFQENKNSTAAAVTDSAWRGTLGLDYSRFTLNAYFQRAGPDYVALGAPNVTKDRVTQDANFSVTPLTWMSFYGTYNSYKDNLDSDSSVVTTKQTIMTGGLSFNLPSYTGLSLGYSLNTALGEPQTAQDNETTSLSAGISQGWKGQSFALSYQTSEFVDNTKTTNDLNTNTMGGSLNLVLGSRISASVGATLSSTEDQIDSSKQDTQSFSVSTNFEIFRDRLVGQIWGSMSATEDDDTTNQTDTQSTSMNAEFTFQVNPKTSWTLGGFRNVTEDAITPTNDVTSNGVNTRISYSF